MCNYYVCSKRKCTVCPYRFVMVSGLDVFKCQAQYDTGGVVTPSHTTQEDTQHNNMVTGLSTAVVTLQELPKSHVMKTMELVFLLIFFPFTLSGEINLKNVKDLALHNSLSQWTLLRCLDQATDVLFLISRPL